jgi:hypothetical protein
MAKMVEIEQVPMTYALPLKREFKRRKKHYYWKRNCRI